MSQLQESTCRIPVGHSRRGIPALASKKKLYGGYPPPEARTCQCGGIGATEKGQLTTEH